MEVDAKSAKWFASVSGVTNYARQSHWNLSNTQKTPERGKFLMGKYEKSSRKYNFCATPVLFCLLLHLYFLGAFKALIAISVGVEYFCLNSLNPCLLQ